MKNIMLCRRTFISALGIAALLTLGLYKGADVAFAIAAIAAGISASNAYENAAKSNKE